MTTQLQLMLLLLLLKSFSPFLGKAGETERRSSFVKYLAVYKRIHYITLYYNFSLSKCAKTSNILSLAMNCISNTCFRNTVLCITMCTDKYTGKGKVHPRTGYEGPEGSRCIALLFLDHSTRRGRGVSATPQPLYPQDRPGTHCIGGWVGPRAGLDGCGKSRPPPQGFDPQTVKLVASRYTDRAISAPNN